VDVAIGLKNEATSQSAISAASLHLKDAYVNAWRIFFLAFLISDPNCANLYLVYTVEKMG
jgi:hypothetical protein